MYANDELDLIMCRRLAGIGELFSPKLTKVLVLKLYLAIGRLCEKCDGKWCVLHENNIIRGWYY